MKKRKLPLLIAFFTLCTAGAAFGQSTKDVINDYLSNSTAVNKDFSNKDFVISNEDPSQSLKGTVVKIQQTYDGIPVFGNYSTFLVRDHKVINFTGDFTKNTASHAGRAGIADGTAILKKAAQNMNLKNPESYSTLLSEGKIRPAELVYFDNGKNLTLAYQLEFEEQNSNNLWFVIADAKTGAVYFEQNLTLSCNFVHEPYNRDHADTADHRHTVAFPLPKSAAPETSFVANNASYRVFEFPVEAPTFGQRTLATNPWDLTSSPNGWQKDGSTEYNITRGNNAHAYLDEMSENAIGASADGGAAHVFDFPLSLPDNLTNYTNAALTNLFYANNKVHDILYKFGFTETAKNFQASNFGKGGQQNDYVLAEARDGAGVADLSKNLYNNANFATPSDGSKPRMQMYIWLGAGPFFNFNAPASVAGTGIPQIGLGYFGPPLWIAPTTGDVAISPVLDACTALPAGSLAGKIGIAQRGNCNFIIKVKNIEDAGAKGAIIYNTADAATNPGDAISNMSGDGTTPINIPSVFLGQTKGEEIIALTNSGQTVNVSLQIPVNDGSLDNGVIAHEYGHGLSMRSTGNAVTCLNSNATKEQMGEGWSDFLALMFTMKPTDNASIPRGIATFASGEAPNGVGIRPAKYSPDWAINGYTYGDTNGMEYTNANGTLVPDVHAIGFVWNTILWDLNWKYAEKYGFNSDITADPNAGPARLFQTVVNGLKLQPCYPTFIDGRNAILSADQAATNGENKCMIWGAFAKRGVGVNASAGAKTNINDQIEDFSVPAECTMATHENSAEKSVNIYPNPAKNEFFLDIKGNTMGKINVSIYDASGKLVSSQKVDASARQAVNTSNLANGIYLVKASGLGFEYSSKLLIKK